MSASLSSFSGAKRPGNPAARESANLSRIGSFDIVGRMDFACGAAGSPGLAALAGG